jgi:hypothetical protein
MTCRKACSRNLVVLVALVVAACGNTSEPADTTVVTTTTATPTTTAATVPAASDEPVFDMAFDGTTCTVVGPTQVPAGVYSFYLTDTSGFDVLAGAIRAGDGHTYDDLVALQAAPGETFTFPSWASLAMFTFAPLARDLAENETRLVLDAGEHAIALVRPKPEAKCSAPPFPLRRRDG